MTRRHLISLAQQIMKHNRLSDEPFTPSQLESLADFCKYENNNFDRTLWLDYIAGKCGPSGGKRK